MSNRPKDNWKSTLLGSNSTIRHAIELLNISGLKIAIVVAADGTLLGTVTDGDVRRGLLRGVELDRSIDEVIHREPLVVPEFMEREMVLELMQMNRLFQLPIVDANRRVVGLHLWDEIAPTPDRTNLIIVMAGGKGIRLRPHTESCPKPLLPIGDKPMLEHLLERARAEGFRHFVFAINYLGQMIEDYFEDGARWDVHINYIREESPLGTVGALSLLLPRPTTSFLVTNGDLLTDIKYGALLDFHSRHGAVGTMAVRQQEWQSPYGFVHTRGNEIIDFEEKPIIRSLVNAGIYALDPSALGFLERAAHCDMPTLFERLREKGNRTLAFPMHEPWIDVGKPEEYVSAQRGALVARTSTHD